MVIKYIKCDGCGRRVKVVTVIKLWDESEQDFLLEEWCYSCFKDSVK